FQALYLARPDVAAYRLRLVEAYRAARRYDSARRIVDRYLITNPEDLPAQAERASLLYLEGDTAEAFRSFEALVGDARDAARVRLVLNAYEALQRPDRALVLIERTGDETAYARDRARLLGLAGRVAEAADAYAALVVGDAQALAVARAGLIKLTQDEAALPVVVDALARRSRREPTNRPLRELYAALALEAGDARRALDETRALDRLDRDGGGRVLMLFARAALDAGAFDAAAEAHNEVLQRYADGPAAPEARLGLGLLYERRAEAASERSLAEGSHSARALTALRAFAAAHGGHPSVPDALARIGRLTLDAGGDVAAATAVLDSVVAGYPRSPAADDAAFTLGRAKLRAGDLDGAGVAFAQLEERLRTGDLADRSRYELALLDLYRGNLDAATTRAEVLAEDASADVANDAIALQLLIIENRSDSLGLDLARYARNALLLRQGRAAVAVDSLGVLITGLEARPNNRLLDDARALRAEALREAGRTAEAAAALEALVAAQPDSYLADRALLDLAELQQHALGQAPTAQATLERLLSAYPGSLLVPEARRRLRVLRGDAGL
ncbi:MAG TPA: tetratricopeptide repeat protein, partial [Rhodothermales bacterium]|nr:tetratricopeptide repeat protein [Rhodothermales bacterium]